MGVVRMNMRIYGILQCPPDDLKEEAARIYMNLRVAELKRKRK